MPRQASPGPAIPRLAIVHGVVAVLTAMPILYPTAKFLQAIHKDFSTLLTFSAFSTELFYAKPKTPGVKADD
jgi:hypothetical protein